MSDGDEKIFVGCGVGALGCLAVIVIGFALIFSGLFYFGFSQRGGVYDDLRVQLSRSQLNQLVPYIELYRARRGAYPEALTDVEEFIPEGTPVGIHDMTAVNLNAPARLYHYERVGDDHFILRGLGADGEAFTADDVVPDGYEPGETGLLLERPPAAPSEPVTPPAPSN